MIPNVPRCRNEGSNLRSVDGFGENRVLTAMRVAPRSNTRKQLDIEFHSFSDTDLLRKNVRDAKNALGPVVLRRIDENNVVEMQTNYTNYQKIPLH